MSDTLTFADGCKDMKQMSDLILDTEEKMLLFERRIQNGHDQLNRFEGRLDEGDARMSRIEKTINENSSSMAHNTADTSEILQIMRDTKTAFKMIGHLGLVIKWVAGIVVALGSVWLLFKDVHK